MANNLRHYSAVPAAAATFTYVTPALVAGRALVVSKVIVTQNLGNNASDMTFAIGIGDGTNQPAAGYIINGLAISPGQAYTETGLVLVGTDRLWVYQTTTGAVSISCNVFGEETAA